MDWEVISTSAEVVGPAGVIASLLYLAVQIRQSGADSKTQSYHLAVDQVVSAVLSLNFMKLLFESETRELSTEEELELLPALNAYLFALETLFYLHKQGRVDTELFEHGFLNNLEFVRLKLPTKILAKRRGSLSAEFREYISRIDRET